jgi:hypothetical protein
MCQADFSQVEQALTESKIEGFLRNVGVEYYFLQGSRALNAGLYYSDFDLCAVVKNQNWPTFSDFCRSCDMVSKCMSQYDCIPEFHTAHRNVLTLRVGDLVYDISFFVQDDIASGQFCRKFTDIEGTLSGIGRENCRINYDPVYMETCMSFYETVGIGPHQMNSIKVCMFFLRVLGLEHVSACLLMKDFLAKAEDSKFKQYMTHGLVSYSIMHHFICFCMNKVVNSDLPSILSEHQKHKLHSFFFGESSVFLWKNFVRFNGDKEEWESKLHTRDELKVLKKAAMVFLCYYYEGIQDPSTIEDNICRNFLFSKKAGGLFDPSYKIALFKKIGILAYDAQQNVVVAQEIMRIFSILEEGVEHLCPFVSTSQLQKVKQELQKMWPNRDCGDFRRLRDDYESADDLEESM